LNLIQLPTKQANLIGPAFVGTLVDEPIDFLLQSSDALQPEFCSALFRGQCVALQSAKEGIPILRSDFRWHAEFSP
jgi:hypothetical protein